MTALERERAPFFQTGNTRIEQAYRNIPDLANIEMTYPVKTDVLYESDVLAKDPSLRQLVQRNLRVIIMPGAFDKLSAEGQQKVTAMASPFECGRVLEIDEAVEINGQKHVISLKGIGATAFIRERKIKSVAMSEVTDEDMKSLQKFAFIDGLGELSKGCAKEELVNSNDLIKGGIDCEQILGIYSILEMPNQIGEIVTPKELVGDGFIRSEAPTILVRAAKSNFRLLDPITFYSLNKQIAIPNLREVVLDQYKKAEGITGKVEFDSYVHFLVNKVLGQEIPLIAQGYEMSSGRWQDLARNISVLGEELDLESVGQDKTYLGNFKGWRFNYREHVAKHVSNADAVLRYFIENIAYQGQKINFNEYADVVFDAIVSGVRGMDIDNIFENIPQAVKKDNEITNAYSLQLNILKTIFSYYKSNILIGGMNVPTTENTKIYQKRIVERIKKVDPWEDE